ncbi:MAG: hypothetical protein DRN08_00190 [Thermoplasmata archaeon]|nr:MAG: hypothetical protein DRN08_00190 [Thermoplasmata archaeon]
MQFVVKKRDGPARIGELTFDNKKIFTPNILFVDTSRIRAPSYADAIITTTDHQKTETDKIMIKVLGSMFSDTKNFDANISRDDLTIPYYLLYPRELPLDLHKAAAEINSKPTSNCCIVPGDKKIIDNALLDSNAKLFIIGNAAQLSQHQSDFVEFITNLREKIGYQKMIYLPYIGSPSNLALLTYLSVDFFDSTYAIIAARNNILLFPDGEYNKNMIEKTPCSCPSCIEFQDDITEMSFQHILNHNYFTFINEIKNIRNNILQGRLRELVETRIRSDTRLTAFLRILDLEHHRFLERRTPMFRSSMLIATTKESMYRPEIKRFQKRVIDRYRKPRSAKILLLLPCSAKKPYSFSKSHKLFKEQLHKIQNPHVVHEIIITSPLGVVPRELELTYPASSYDIPVTGQWDEDEKKIIRTLLHKYLTHNKYDKIIMHIPPAIQDFTLDLFRNPIITCNGNPTSRESLQKLLDALKKTTKNYEKTLFSKRARENVECLASFQFGRKPAQTLLAGSDIKGGYPYRKIMYKKMQLGMVTERGLISLTLEGAKRIAEKSQVYWVEMYDDFTLKGNLFAPGVKDADQSIRIGDEVAVLKNNKTCAVGVAQMNAWEMIESNKGEAVKIRHRI